MITDETPTMELGPMTIFSLCMSTRDESMVDENPKD